ncbi:hypothetical protein ACFQ49_09700 [Kroppenstedtia eburnea]|uniref:Uncharacterized protein n=1 Tax=Kroppenstedtia eburnea TaxID=714067 RepID=A0A1N7KFM1_9BACL|nr:hypothetical protein [Kroppenstedtia eburnea]EGK11867.1 hypothetical protein HMPREF9374_1730 [Desmospora sp. 8437]QKI83007.1 asparagine synthase [Kroppenstedtia eburnea]SIS60375.1 hypothetical protein SAMN05421790_10345 [Kroppenstedtia eburnea]
MMRKGLVTLALGLAVTLLGMCVLYRRERLIGELRERQTRGWGVYGFGLAHILLGGLAAVIGRIR